MLKVLPHGYKAKLRLHSDNVPWLWLVLSGGAIFVAGLALFLIALVASRPQLPLVWVFVFPISFLAGLMLHEGIHGICIRLFGAKPHFGVAYRGGRLFGFYTTAPGYFFTRSEFALIALAPFLTLTVAGLIVIWLQPVLLPWLGPLVILNASASVGDLWLGWKVLRQPRDVLVEDKEDALIFHLPTSNGNGHNH